MPFLSSCSLRYFAASLFLFTFTNADTLYLFDGREIEGTLVRETEEEIEFHENFSDTISIPYIFPREEVLRIAQISEDKIAAEEIERLLPAPELLDSEGYHQLLEQTEHFLQTYPESRQKSRIETIHTRLQAELARTEQGSLFLQGQWLEASALANRQHEISATRHLLTLEQALENRQWAHLMEHFDTLEQHYRGTQAFLEARTLALGTLEAEGFLQSYRHALIRILNDLNSTTEEQLAQPSEEIRLLRQQQKQAGRRWLAVDSADLKQLEEAIQLSESELTRLAEEDLNELRKQAQAVTEIVRLLDHNTPELAQQNLDLLLKEEQETGSAVIEFLQQRCADLGEQ